MKRARARASDLQLNGSMFSPSSGSLNSLAMGTLLKVERVLFVGRNAEILHRADELVPRCARSPQPVLLGQEEIPQAQGGGGRIRRWVFCCWY